MKTKEKLVLLRDLMEKNKVDLYIVPSSDPHISEYLPDYWKSRGWISGFTGSAGIFAITQEKAVLFTDSRYFLQAEKELANSGIELCKQGLPETPSLESWVTMQLRKGDVAGIDGRVFQVSMAKNIIEHLHKWGIECKSNADLISPIWNKRPKLPISKAFTHDLKYAGESVGEKIREVRNRMKSNGITSYLICALDDVNWLFNIRGNDISYNPVVLSYGFIDNDKATLFIDTKKIDENIANQLNEQGVTIKPYEKVKKFISKIDKKEIILIDPTRTNYGLYTSIPNNVQMVEKTGIVTELKAHKNSIELEGFRNAMVEDGTALVEFFYWLEDNLEKTKITETLIAEKLTKFRSKRNEFVSESFSPIVGYADHGAIVHFSATKETEYEIKPKGFLLIDSGGQYHNGTTDITRTIHLSEPTEEEKVDYTLVLKGMIQLAMARFPIGTRGSQLDTLARMAMWSKNINYGHGTGHGVGSFLNVHEGPMQIRPDNHLPIEVGQVLSNEPGLYRSGKHGIRTENLITCVPDTENKFGEFLKFETLTLCPIDTKPIKVDMLLQEEKEWLNDYHKKVYERLSLSLNKTHREWLKEKTKKI
ncbi:MAG: aminopeptidase P family protein [Bacteroidales bacterium]|nr:MAG: aminopeptidase P family protein [Bacteroidales bacterium]